MGGKKREFVPRTKPPLRPQRKRKKKVHRKKKRTLAPGFLRNLGRKEEENTVS